MSNIKNYLEISNDFHIITKIDFINKSLRCQTIFINSERAFIDIYMSIKNDKLLLTDFGTSIQSILTWGLCTSKFLEKEYFQDLIQNITETYRVTYNRGVLELLVDDPNITLNKNDLIQKIIDLCQACIRISDLYLIFHVKVYKTKREETCQ